VVLNLAELLFSPVCIIPDPELSPVFVGKRSASSSSMAGKLCLNSSSSSGPGWGAAGGRLWFIVRGEVAGEDVGEGGPKEEVGTNEWGVEGAADAGVGGTV
jgi:hypothetical protein